MTSKERTRKYRERLNNNPQRRENILREMQKVNLTSYQKLF